MNSSIKMLDQFQEFFTWLIGWVVGGTFWISSVIEMQVNPYSEIYLLLTSSTTNMSVIDTILAFVQALAPVMEAFVTGLFIQKVKQKEKDN